ncbi:MAG: BrnT family toxin, partial [Alphaproteobacteria bacterium]|nr:BrnT family toxin [Alphaproteobacteria bacterium]
MVIEYDQAKRDRTLLERGLDFARADEIFAGIHFTGVDARVDYQEKRL